MKVLDVCAFLLAGIAGSCASSTFAASDNSVTSAYNLCAAFDRTGLATEKCEVHGWGSSVDVRIDMGAAEARETCAGVVDIARKKGWTFDTGWTFKIFSPYSGDHPIASCAL